MSKIELSPLPSGFQTTTALNQRLQLIEDALNNDVLWRDNPEGEPNFMDNELDMNGKRIINLPDAINENEPVTYAQLLEAVEVNFSFGLEREIDTVSNFALLVANIGERVVTKGCQSVGDGGHGTFIVEAASGTPDGYSRVLLANGNHAVLQPTNGFYSLLQLGCVGDGVTDNASRISSISDLNVNILINDGDFISSAPLELQSAGLMIKGQSRDGSILRSASTTEPALHLMGQYNTASNFSILGTAARYAAAYTSNGFGIQVETTDVADDPLITRQRGVILENLVVEGHTGAAVYMVGPVTDGGAMRNCRILNNKGHAIAMDRGFLRGRTNKSTLPVGVINITNCLAFGNTGHALALGHPSDTATTQTVRVVVDNYDANISSMDSTQLYSATYDHGFWIAGSNIEVINCVTSGDGTQCGAFVRGTNNTFRNFRQVETVATLEIGDNVAGLPTRDIVLDGVNVINTTPQSDAVILGNATNVQDVSIRISNMADITNIVDTTTIRGLVLNNPTSFARSASNTVYNNTTTPTAINGLSYRAAENEEIRFKVGIFYSGDSAADLRVTVGSTASVSSIQFGPTGGTKVGASLSVDVIAAVTALNSPISLGCDGSKRFFEFSGHLVNGASAATITINAAQLSAVSADTTVYAGSFFTVERFVS